jgi:hypothetical protein
MRPVGTVASHGLKRALLHSGLYSNAFTGSVGSWIGSMAKLTLLYAPLHGAPHGVATKHSG